MNYKKIVIIGGGILGSQIAFQTAYSGFDVTVLILESDNKNKIKESFKKLADTYVETINAMAGKDGLDHWARGIAEVDSFNKKVCLERVNKALESIEITTSQEKALNNADLVIESITENIDVKKALYEEIAPKLDVKTVIVTNSSTLLPSKLAASTKRPEKFLALHFANHIWKNNIAEVMGHANTEQKYFDEIVAFANSIHMVPLAALEEKSGYLLNSMLVPFLLSAMDLLANGVSDAETIDKAWTLGTGAPNGPFEILDVVGLITARNIVFAYQKVPNIFDPLLKKMMLPYNFDGMLKILDEYIDAGKLGKASGEGFYKYDH